MRKIEKEKKNNKMSYLTTDMLEKAASKSQQRLMGQAYALKKGDLSLSDIDPKFRDEIERLAGEMTEKDLEKFAETKHKGLPERVPESSLKNITNFDAFDVSEDDFDYSKEEKEYWNEQYHEGYIEEQVKDFLKRDDTPTDEDVHKLAESMGISIEELEGRIYAMLKRRLED